MTGPPEPGSVMEALCLMVQVRRELKELYRTRATVQAAILCQHPESTDTGESVRGAYNDYKNALMPFLVSEAKKDQDNIVKAMQDEAARGPMVVSALEPMRVSSRLRTMDKSKVPELGSRVRSTKVKKW